tara:strand:- start:518 stop:715 length:198 start_codon:yes stop_codon:yes gene_type:complete
MFFDIEKLEELEKKVTENLTTADNHNWQMPHKPYWVNYRNDMPRCLMVIREYKSLLEQLKAKNDE